MGGAATQAMYTCGSPPAPSSGGWRWVGWERGVGRDLGGTWRAGQGPPAFFWDSGDTNPTPSVGVGKGQAGSRKVSGKQKDSFLVIAGIPATRLLKE